MELRGPIALITGDVVRLRSDEWGTVELPMRPVRNVSGIVYDSGQVQSFQYLTLDHQLVQGLARLAWVTVTYDHGWDENSVPPVVRTIVDRLTARLLSTPDDSLRAESIGSYRVDYDTSARWLRPEEVTALSRFRRATFAVANSPSTEQSPAEKGAPFGSWPGWWGT